MHHDGLGAMACKPHFELVVDWRHAGLRDDESTARYSALLVSQLQNPCMRECTVQNCVWDKDRKHFHSVARIFESAFAARCSVTCTSVPPCTHEAQTNISILLRSSIHQCSVIAW
jgi:hypothetical protein